MSTSVVIEKVKLKDQIGALLTYANFNDNVSDELQKKLVAFVLDYGKEKGLSRDDLHEVMLDSILPF